jgi:hypothetical protein
MMARFSLKTPVNAARYEFRGNEDEVMAVVRSTGRTGMSMDNMHGYLHVYNGGPELRIRDGQWAVAIGDDVAVLTHDKFAELFQAEDAQSDHGRPH